MSAISECDTVLVCDDDEVVVATIAEEVVLDIVAGKALGEDTGDATQEVVSHNEAVDFTERIDSQHAEA